MEEKDGMSHTSSLVDRMLLFLDHESNDELDISNTNIEEEMSSQRSSEPSCVSGDDNQSEISLLEREMNKTPASESPVPNLEIKLPFWEQEEDILSDPVWRTHNPIGAQNESAIARSGQWYSNSKRTQRQTSTSYIVEVNRAIYGDITGHPSNDSPEFHQAAQNYALHGRDFLDFPRNLEPLIDSFNERDDDVFDADISPFSTASSGLASGIFSPPVTVPPGFSYHHPRPHLTAAAAANTSATYYQLCNTLQPTFNQGIGPAAFGILMGNKVSYMATATPPAVPLIFNQHTTATSSVFSNNLTTTAAFAASSSAILYANPVIQATTQQYLNNFLKDNHLLQAYAQMLHQQLYQQSQQQAAAVAAMIQQSQQRLARTNYTNALANSQMFAQPLAHAQPVRPSAGQVAAAGPPVATIDTSSAVVTAPILIRPPDLQSGFMGDLTVTVEDELGPPPPKVAKPTTSFAAPQTEVPIGLPVAPQPATIIHSNQAAAAPANNPAPANATPAGTASASASMLNNMPLGAPPLTLCARQAAMNSNATEAQLKSQSLMSLRDVNDSDAPTNIKKQ